MNAVLAAQWAGPNANKWARILERAEATGNRSKIKTARRQLRRASQALTSWQNPTTSNFGS